MDILTFGLKLYGKILDAEPWPGITYEFKFECMPKLQCRPNHNMHYVIVRFSSFLDWGLSDDDLIGVLYWFACKEIIKNPLIKEHVKELLPSNSPNKCPVDLNDIKFPNPPPFEVQIQKKIGF